MAELQTPELQREHAMRQAVKQTLSTWKGPRPDPLVTWLSIKALLRTRMSRANWDLAVRPIRLLRVYDNALLAALPPSGRAIYKFEGYKKLMLDSAARTGYGILFTVYPDEYAKEKWKDLKGEELAFLDPEPEPAKRKVRFF